MGLAAYGRPTMTEQVRQVIRRTADGGFALDLEYFEYQTTASAIVLLAVRRAVRAAAQPLRPDRPRDRRRPALRGLRRQRAARARGHAGGHRARAPSRNRSGRSLPRRRRGAQRRRQRAHPRASPASSACSCRPAPGDAGCALGAALYADRIYFGNPDRDVPRSSLLGTGRRRRGPGARGARGRSGRRRAGRCRAHRAGRRRARRRPHRRLDGRRDGVRARGRWATAASWLRRIRPRCATASTATSSTARSSGRSPRSCPSKPPRRYFELPPGGARLARFMSGVFPVRPEWRERLAAVTHVDGTARLQALEREHGAAAARAARGLRPAHRHSGPAQHLVQPRRRADREPRALEGYSTLPALRDRRARRRPDPGVEARASPAARPPKEDVRMVVRKRSGSPAPSDHARQRSAAPIADLGPRSVAQRARATAGSCRWPCSSACSALVLILATTVEALAPFIYAIF